MPLSPCPFIAARARRAAAHLLTPVAALGAAVALAACGGALPTPTARKQADSVPVPAAAGPTPAQLKTNVYAGTGPADLSALVRHDKALVYVPNTLSNTVTVISQRTLKVIATVPVGLQPQHVTPAWNLKTLYVDNDVGNSLTPIDPRTGPVRAPDPG